MHEKSLKTNPILEKVLARGERIELLVDKTENLQSNAFKFKKQSSALKRAMWFKNVRLMIVIIVIIIVSIQPSSILNCTLRLLFM